MKRTASLAVLVTLIAFLMPVSADDLNAVKARMSARLGAVKTMVLTQKAGENKAGYLTARSGLNPEEQRAMDAENTDRKQVYAAIAAKTGVSVEQVGAQRAQAIARQAPSGTWLQDSGGKWYRKP